MTVQLPALDDHLWQTYARFRSVGPVIPLEMPGGVMVWAATTHAAVREVLQGRRSCIRETHLEVEPLCRGPHSGGLRYGVHPFLESGCLVPDSVDLAGHRGVGAAACRSVLGRCSVAQR